MTRSYYHPPGFWGVDVEELTSWLSILDSIYDTNILLTPPPHSSPPIRGWRPTFCSFGGGAFCCFFHCFLSSCMWELGLYLFYDRTLYEIWGSQCSEKDRLNIYIYRGFNERFGLCWDRREALIKILGFCAITWEYMIILLSFEVGHVVLEPHFKHFNFKI